MKFTLKSGQVLKVVSIQTQGSTLRGINTHNSDLDILIIYKWQNINEVLAPFPNRISRNPRDRNSSLFTEILGVAEPIVDLFSSIYKVEDSSSLDIKMVEVYQLCESIYKSQSLEGLEALANYGINYSTSNFKKVTSLYAEAMFNYSHYLNILLHRIKSTFNSHKSQTVEKSFKNLANVIYLKRLFEKQKGQRLFIPTLDIRDIKELKEFKSTFSESTYNDYIKEVETFLISMPSNFSFSKPNIESFNKFLSKI